MICTGCGEPNAKTQKLDAGDEITWWHLQCWHDFLAWLREDPK